MLLNDNVTINSFVADVLNDEGNDLSVLYVILSTAILKVKWNYYILKIDIIVSLLGLLLSLSNRTRKLE